MAGFAPSSPGIPHHQHTGHSDGAQLPEDAIIPGPLLVRTDSDATLGAVTVDSIQGPSGTLNISGTLTLDANDQRILAGLSQFGFAAGDGSHSLWLPEDPDSTLAIEGTLLACDLDGKVTLSAQTANISATSLVPNEAVRGVWAVIVIHTCTAAGSAGTLSTTIRWSDANGAQSAKPAADLGLTGTGYASGILILDHVSNANGITYETAIAGGAGSPAYRLVIRAVLIG